ncbi:uncharacterized protein LOC111889854 [Lactuca sativa]|uniref:uncharacterized protein LOC111889854 n=1 Tax=Lactuca sativa TaxID=4236 RepID=UPI000CD9623F|nr:uncharacterized protein LOC111889854 [Lactuca sativa]
MDEEGNKIQGYVHKAYIYKFKQLLKEVNGFDFIEYRTIINGTVLENMSLVVVGEIDARSAERKRHKIRLQIQDDNGLQLDVNLWGNYSYTFLDYIQKNPNNVCIVIILQFAKISVWQDCDPSIRTMMYRSSSSIFESRCSENDDFLLNNDLKTIADIFEPLEKKKYVIVATIKGILQNKDWYYPACTNCNTKAFSDTPSNEANVIGSFQYAKYECRNPKCTKTVTSVLPRFMISVRDQDHTGSMTLTMFEQDAKKLL